MKVQSRKIEDKAVEEFYRVKTDLKHRPSRLEFFTYMDDNLYANIRAKSKINIFNNYLSFLRRIDELQEDEKKIIFTVAHEFIKSLSPLK